MKVHFERQQGKYYFQLLMKLGIETFVLRTVLKVTQKKKMRFRYFMTQIRSTGGSYGVFLINIRGGELY